MTDAQATPQPEVATIPEVDTAVVRGVVPTGELPCFFDRSFSALGAAMTQLGATPSGPAFAYYLRPPEVTSELEVGFPSTRPWSVAVTSSHRGCRAAGSPGWCIGVVTTAWASHGAGCRSGWRSTG